jgi:hypothetical protein
VICIYDRPRGTLYPQKLALTSPASGCLSVGIVRSRTKAKEFSFSFMYIRVQKSTYCEVPQLHEIYHCLQIALHSKCMEYFLCYNDFMRWTLITANLRSDTQSHCVSRICLSSCILRTRRRRKTFLTLGLFQSRFPHLRTIDKVHKPMSLSVIHH